MYRVSVRVPFSAAHRLTDYIGKCACLHGHEYEATVVVKSNRLDDAGMAVDFGVLKGRVRAWINGNWDHNVILNATDPLLWVNESLTDPGTPHDEATLVRRFGRRPFVLPYNPTAERMSEYLNGIVKELLVVGYDGCTAPVPGVEVESATVLETRDCFASYSEF